MSYQRNIIEKRENRMKNALNKVYRQKKHIKILALIIIGILFTYGYTVNFSVAGDGLMHMHDHTALQQPGDWARIFFASCYE